MEFKLKKAMNYAKRYAMFPICIGEHEGRSFRIYNTMGFPTAYVKLTEEEAANRASCTDLDIEVHGGLTYFGKPAWECYKSSIWIGWDYAHAGDYLPLLRGFGNKKYTTDLVLQDIESVIEQLKNLPKEENKEDV